MVNQALSLRATYWSKRWFSFAVKLLVILGEARVQRFPRVCRLEVGCSVVSKLDAVHIKASMLATKFLEIYKVLGRVMESLEALLVGKSEEMNA